MGRLFDDALDAGVHEECWHAGRSGACSDCYEIIMQLLDARYADVPSDRVRVIMYTDIADGRL